MTEKQISLGDLLFNLMKIKDYYQSELNKENKELSRYIKDLEKRKEKKVEIDINQTEIDTKDFWKKLILTVIDELLKKINSRKTRISEFSEIKADLEKTKEDIPYDNPEIETLRSYYEEDLKKYRDQIKEKIDIEKFTNKRFWLGLLIGFILGILASVVFWLIQIFIIK